MGRCLILAGLLAGSLAAQPLPPPGGGGIGEIRVVKTNSVYRAAQGGLSGRLRSNQSADILLGGVDFNQTGGGLLFNHPRSMASDGQRLLVTDGNNNRILIWTTLPDSNTPPDLVLGQPDFDANSPGDGLHQLNWPGQIAVTSVGLVVVADTFNDRLLVWREFPSSNAQPADLEIRHQDLRWPWGVWTDGARLVASSTGGRAVLIWNRIPATNAGAAPDLRLRPPEMGTPRTITSDGTNLIVGDHNAFQTRVGNFFWKKFPSDSNDPYDFFASDPTDPNRGWLHGTFLGDGTLLMLGGQLLYRWPQFPENETTRPEFTLRHRFGAGDGGSVVYAGGRTYVLEYNGNRITVFDGVPDQADQRPVFTIASPSPEVNTLLSEFFITNPVPASNGRNLFVSSDFDRRLLVWNQLPDQSGAKPDWVYELPFQPWDNAVHGETFALAGQQEIAIWRALPLNGEMPELRYRQRLGEIRFDALSGIAIDDRYFYLADGRQGKIYVYGGIPPPDAEPVLTFELRGVTRLASDGRYLVATVTEGGAAVFIYRIEDLTADYRPSMVGGPGVFNLPQSADIRDGRLIVGNTNFNTVMIWNNVEDAMARRPPDVVLGGMEARPQPPRIGRDTLFWPGMPSFDGSYLWIGEFKFSNRLVRFSTED